MENQTQIVDLEFQVKYGSPLIGSTIEKIESDNVKYMMSFAHYHKTTKPEEMPTANNRRSINDNLKIKPNEWYHVGIDSKATYSILKSCITLNQLQAIKERRREEKLAERLSLDYAK